MEPQYTYLRGRKIPFKPLKKREPITLKRAMEVTSDESIHRGLRKVGAKMQQAGTSLTAPIVKAKRKAVKSIDRGMGKGLDSMMGVIWKYGDKINKMRGKQI